MLRRIPRLNRSYFSYMGDNIVNFYAGQPPLNRLSFQRPATDKLNAHLANSAAQFTLYKDGKPLMHKEEPSHTLFLSRPDVESIIEGGFLGVPSTEVEPTKLREKLFESARLPSTLPTLIFLGIDDRAEDKTVNLLDPLGVPYFALDATNISWDPEVVAGEWGDARASGSAMSGWEAGIFALARALIDWNARNKFCPACGSPTYSLWGGWKRNCTTAVTPIEGKPVCFSTTGLHNFAYPRTDPVIIMGILDSSGEHMLLGRQKSWPKGMYSCLAGFIEPGESFEDAVRREVLEEAGIEVGPVRYSSSQPWPYPANVMVGCYGRARDGQTIRLDLDNELEDAQWFPRSLVASLFATAEGTSYSRADLKQLDKATGQHRINDAEIEAALAPAEGKTVQPTNNVFASFSRVPPATAIAGQLIRLWAEGDLELVSKL